MVPDLEHGRDHLQQDGEQRGPILSEQRLQVLFVYFCNSKTVILNILNNFFNWNNHFLDQKQTDIKYTQ